MTQVNSSPGVPRAVSTVTATSATTILAGKVILTTETNVREASLIESAVVVPYSSSSPIVLPTQVGFR
jgi:hypothetical protein